MQPEQSPEVTVLVGYANENLQLRIENAQLQARIEELEKTPDGPGGGDD